MKTFRLLIVFIFIAVSLSAQDKCETTAYRQQLLTDASLAPAIIRAEIPPKQVIREIPSTANGSRQPELPIIRIPVVVHIIYNSESQNISAAQIKAQLDILNKDFRNKNEQKPWVPEAFARLAADSHIEFQLATIDPSGNPSTGIIRRRTSIQVFTYDDRIKFSSIGGSDAWDAGSYLNIWVGSLAGGLTGYSSPLGGPADRDGIVISYKAFGKTGIGQTGHGRTATHEVGHWLGLKHIWGDSYCGDDAIDDTPPQQSATRGCPGGLVTSCNNSGNMYMNFMDFTNDECTSMFTYGQATRMRSAFEPGSFRHALLTSNGLSGPVVEETEEQEEITLPVKFFPNPVSGMVTVQLETQDNLIGQPITVYNALGQQVHQALISKGQIQLDMTRFREGLYYVSLGNKRKLFKLVKR